MGKSKNPATQFSSTYQPAVRGRKPDKPNLKTLIQKVWFAADPKDVDESGDPRIAGLKVVKALLDKASDGDVAAFKALAERMEGMPTQHTELSGGLNNTMMSTIKINGKGKAFDVGDK